MISAHRIRISEGLPAHTHHDRGKAKTGATFPHCAVVRKKDRRVDSGGPGGESSGNRGRNRSAQHIYSITFSGFPPRRAGPQSYHTASEKAGEGIVDAARGRCTEIGFLGDRLSPPRGRQPPLRPDRSDRTKDPDVRQRNRFMHVYGTTGSCAEDHRRIRHPELWVPYRFLQLLRRTSNPFPRPPWSVFPPAQSTFFGVPDRHPTGVRGQASTGSVGRFLRFRQHGVHATKEETRESAWRKSRYETMC